MKEESKLTLFISTGGTGGHLFPALSIAEEAKRRKHQVFLIIGGEKISIKLKGLRSFRISASSMERNLYSKLKSIYLLGNGFAMTLKILSKYRKSNKIKILATGSYASFPVLAAALLLRIPYYLMEQNAIPGKVVSFFSKWSSGVFVSFQETFDYFNGKNVYLTGNPVREEIICSLSQNEAKKELGFEEGKPLIFVIGGSQGALRLIQVATNLSEELPNVQFLIQTGKHQHLFEKRTKINVKYIPFIDKVGVAYRASDLIISRAGGGTLSELFLYGKPAILVPFPFSKMDHQMKNAKIAEMRGGAIIVEEKELETKLKKIVENLLRSDKLEEMGKMMKDLAKPKAAVSILNRLEEGD